MKDWLVITMNNQKITIICGHYGSGKTNFSLNLAIDSAKKGEKVTLVDMDLVNPYFRSSDYKEILKEYDIDVIAPVYAGTNVDIPSLSPDIYSIFVKEGHVILDVGGDDVGATVLGRFSERFEEVNYELLYVINKHRNLIAEPEDAVHILREIEEVARVKATAIVNNSHLKELTSAETVIKSMAYANEVADKLNLPLIYSTVPKSINEELINIDSSLQTYPIDIYVKTVWE